MPSVWPPRVPDLLNPGVDFLLKNPIDTPEWQAVCEHVQAIFNFLGVNPQADKGTVANRIASLSTMLVGLGTTDYRNLRIGNVIATPNTQLAVTADLIAVEGLIVSSVALTVDIGANTGKNGITFTRAPNLWGYLWLGVNAATLEVAGIFDASADRTALNLAYANLDGFRNWRRVGAARLDGSSNLLRFAQRGETVSYTDDPQTKHRQVSSQAPTGTWQDVAPSTHIPATAAAVDLLGVLIASGSSSSCALSLREKGLPGTTYGTNPGASVCSLSGGIANEADFGLIRLALASDLTFQWATSATPGSTLVHVDVRGYSDPV